MENAEAVSGNVLRCFFILHSSFFLYDLVEPEGVAPSPRRSKSPVPVCCGFGSAKVVLAAGFAPALATFSTSCLCWLGYASRGEHPRPVSSTGSCRRAAPPRARRSLELLRARGCSPDGGMTWTCTTLPGFRGAHCLADRPGALVRLTFLETGPRGRSCTCNLSVLSGTPLAGWATRGWCPRPDLHRHWARFKGAVSALDYVGGVVPRGGFAPPTFPF